MKIKLLTTTLLVFCVVTAFATIDALTGAWSGAVKGPDGNHYPLTYNFQVDGDKLTGTVKTSFGETTVDKGNIAGNEFSFISKLHGVEVQQTGKFMGDSVLIKIGYDGDELSTVLKRKNDN